MPIRDIRTEVTNTGAKHMGKRTVVYRNATKRSMSAVVIGAGTASGLKLGVGTRGDVIDNVPVCSASVKNSCYVDRHY